MATNTQLFQSTNVLLERKCAGHGFHREAGVAVVEFALVLPVLLLIFFSIIEFSIGIYDQAILTNASREAARAGIVFKVPRLTEAQIKDIAYSYCKDNLITFGPSAPPEAIAPSPDGTEAGKPLKVTVTYNYHGLALGALLSSITGPLKLSAVTTMNYE